MEWSSILLNIWGILWMLIFFGSSIFVHEFGHFIMAKKRGLHVPVFSIGFGPKLFSWKRGETTYCLSLFPLGGYARIPQLGEIPVLEGASKIPLSSVSFTDKVLVASMGAIFNLLFAFLIATLLWIVGLSIPVQDKSTTIGYILPEWTDPDGNTQIAPALQAGLQLGDRILKVDDQPIENFSDIEKYIILGTRVDEKGQSYSAITFERNKQIQTVKLYPSKIQTNVLTHEQVRFSGIIAPEQALLVERVEAGSAAEKIGLRANDQILALDDQPMHSFLELRTYLNEKQPESVLIKFKRQGETLQLSCNPIKVPQQKAWLQVKKGSNGLLGFYMDEVEGQSCVKVLISQGEDFVPFEEDALIRSCDGVRLNRLEDLEILLSSFQEKNLIFELGVRGQSRLVSLPLSDLVLKKHEVQYMCRLGILFQQKTILTHPTPWAQFAQSIRSTWETLSRLFNRHSDIKLQHLMGVPSVMRLLHHFSTDDFRRLLWFIVLLNVNLAILNLLPIPVLDGGHILFACLEKIRGKALPEKFANAVQMVFVLFFLGLMIYVTIFDLRRWQGDLELVAEQKCFEKLAIPIQLH